LEIRHTRALHVTSTAATLAHPDDKRKKATASTYKSLDASGGSVFLNLIRPAMLD
jgi:hypothetical protein